MKIDKLQGFLMCAVLILLEASALARYASGTTWMMYALGVSFLGGFIFFLHYIPTKGRLLWFGKNTGVVWDDGFCFVPSFGSFLSSLTYKRRLPFDVVNYEEEAILTTNSVNINHDYDQARPNYNINTQATLFEMETHRIISIVMRFIFVSWQNDGRFLNNSIGFRIILLSWVIAFTGNHLSPITASSTKSWNSQPLVLYKVPEGHCVDFDPNETLLIEISSQPTRFDNIYSQIEVVSNNTTYQSTWDEVISIYQRGNHATIVLKTTASDHAGKICF